MQPVDTAPAAGEPQPEVSGRFRRLRAGPGRRRVVIAAAVVLALLVALGFWWLTPAGPPPLTPTDVDQAVQRGLEQAEQDELAKPADATTAYQAIGPSLVTVTTQRPGAPAAPGMPTEFDLGSGVVINAAGAVLTALHVVDGGGPIQVEFADGTRSSARILASQPDHDIAVLAPVQQPQLVVPAVLAGPPPVGGTVFAVGNPLGLQRSLSAGVVSAENRAIGTDRGPTLGDLIQFDAAVNPGNSGGPLLNRAGQVVGIVTGLANPARQSFFVGIGFAVPIATATSGVGGPQQ